MVSLLLAAALFGLSSANADEGWDKERCERAIEEGILEERQFAKEIIVFRDSKWCRVKVVFSNQKDWSKFGKTRADRGVYPDQLKAPYGNPIKIIAKIE
jgi:hypothetical protein